MFFGGNRGRTIVELPEVSNLPIPEFSTVGIYTQVFPTLFPVSLGDPSIPENQNLNLDNNHEEKQMSHLIKFSYYD